MTYDIAALKRKVITVYPFFGSVAACTEYIETEGAGRLTNDGRNIYYDPQYLADLAEPHRISALAHELCHVAFRHFARGRGKDPVIWENAADAVINQMLKRDGLEIVPGGLDYPEAIGYDAEQYYEILLAEKLDMDLAGGQVDGMQNPAGAENNSESSSEEENDDSDDDNKDSDDAGNDDDQEVLLEIGEEDDDDDENEDGEEELIEQKESDAGNAVRRDVRTVHEGGTAAPLIDWRLLLQDTINYGVDWSYINAVMEDGIVRPVLQEMPVPETEIVLDTSWSVDEELLRAFLRECRHILTFSKMKAGCFDTVFYGFHDIRTAKDIEEMEFQGGGGTDFNAAAEAFTMRVDNRIIFTDGQAPMPEKPLNAIWVVYGDEEIAPEGGTVIHIPPDFFLERR